MGLQGRLSLIITGIFAVVLAAGSALIIHHARRAVEVEVRSTASLALRLIEAALGAEALDADFDGRLAMLRRIGRITGIRHLRVELVAGDEDFSLASDVGTDSAVRQRLPPSWFVRLVKPDISDMQRVVKINDAPFAKILIRPEPGDEIIEAWKEAVVLLGLLVAFFSAAMLLVFIALGRALRPIKVILDGLEHIGRGDYDSRLPLIEPPELGAIAKRFNHMAQELAESRRQNRFLAQHSLAIQESERRRLARELHDEMGQSISAIKAIAVSLIQREPGTALAKQLGTIADICTQVYEVVRRMIYQLRPAVLDELGLVAALETGIDDWNAHHQDVFCRLEVHGHQENLAEEIQITVFRVVQECLTNIAKHANATRAAVRLSFPDRGSTSGGVSLRISDNGQGFNPRETPPGFGLLGIRERVEAIGGRFVLQTTRGSGVTIEIKLPVESACVDRMVGE